MQGRSGRGGARVRSPGRTWVRAALAAPVAVLALGCQSAFERDALEGRPCPCLPDWVCDTTAGGAGICLSKSAGLGGNAGVDPEDGGAGSAATGGENAGGGAAGAGSGGDGSGSGGASAGGLGGAGSGGTSGDGCPALAAPTAEACPEVCDECAQGMCFIRCDTARPCSSTSLACPAGFHCEVNCTSDDSCNSLELACSDGYACSTQCTGRRACAALSMICAAGPCALECGAGPQICRGSELHCGTGACQATCEGNERPLVSGCEASCSTACDC